MYIVVNNQIKMSKGKTASQVGHVVMMITAYLVNFENRLFRKYVSQGMPKIILQADNETIHRWSETASYKVHDAGRTQVEPGTLTVVGYAPTNHKPPELLSLKLL